ncbi:MAG: tetratricopeptide repeat protein [Cyanobacteria bacterium SZAS TMP-1]|nr:tetratricopeptide repeat protein [Cyanobacteria bacterium SZAS TMP-1]
MNLAVVLLLAALGIAIAAFQITGRRRRAARKAAEEKMRARAAADHIGVSETLIPVPSTRVSVEAPPAPTKPKPTAAELIAEGDEFKRQGQYDEAIEAYESAAEAMTAESGRESMAFADLLIKTEDAYFARDNQDDTDELNCDNYLRALSIYEHCSGVFTPKLFPVIDRVISFYLLVGKLSEADSLMRRRQMLQARNDQAAREWQQKLAAAEQAGEPQPKLTRSLTITAPAILDAHRAMRSELATGNKEVDQAANDGDIARSENDYDAAIEHYQSALETAQEAFGRDAVQLVPILVRLGEVYHVRDIFDSNDEGEPYTDPADHLNLALSLLVRDGGPEDIRMVPVLIDLVAYWDQAGDHYKADRYLSMIDSINEKQRRIANS